MALAHADGRRDVFPTRPRQVYDITGAGDMVMAVLGMALAAGADYDPPSGSPTWPAAWRSKKSASPS